jgi:DNA-binding transcriptional MerR regulator
MMNNSSNRSRQPESIYTSHNNFSSGELTPTIQGRTDLELYKNGAETLINALVLPSGGITRRNGTKMVHLFNEHRTRVFAELKFNNALSFLVVFEMVNRQKGILGVSVLREDELIEYFTVNDIVLNPETFSFVSYQGLLYVSFGLDYPLHVLRPNEKYILNFSEQISKNIEKTAPTNDVKKFLLQPHQANIRYYTDQKLSDFKTDQVGTKKQLEDQAKQQIMAMKDYYWNLRQELILKNEYVLTLSGTDLVQKPSEEKQEESWGEKFSNWYYGKKEGGKDGKQTFPWALDKLKQEVDKEGKTHTYTLEKTLVREMIPLADDFLWVDFTFNVRLKTDHKVMLKMEMLDEHNEVYDQEHVISTRQGKYHNVSLNNMYIQKNRFINNNIRTLSDIRLSITHLIDQDSEEIDLDASDKCYISHINYKLSIRNKIDTNKDVATFLTYSPNNRQFPSISIPSLFADQSNSFSVLAHTICPQQFYVQEAQGKTKYYTHQTKPNYNDQDFVQMRFDPETSDKINKIQIANLHGTWYNDPEDDTVLKPIKRVFMKSTEDSINKKLKETLDNFVYLEDIATKRVEVQTLINGVHPDNINKTLEKHQAHITDQSDLYCNAIAMYNNRLWCFGARDNIHAVFVSAMGDFTNFNMTYHNLLDVKNPMNPFYVVINSETSDPILWTIPFAGELLIGTTDGIYSLKEGKREHGEFIKLTKEIDLPLSDIKPVVLAKSIFIVEKGNKKIHNISFSKEKGGFQLFDVTIYAEHLFSQGILNMSGLTSPFPMLFVQTRDRHFKVLSFHYDLKMFGWSQHILGGHGLIHHMMAHNGAMYFYVVRPPQEKSCRTSAHLEKLSIATEPHKVPQIDCYMRYSHSDDGAQRYRVLDQLASQLQQFIDMDFNDHFNSFSSFGNVCFSADQMHFFEVSFMKEDFNKLSEGYSGYFKDLLINGKPVITMSKQTQISIHYFMRSLEYYGTKRIKSVVDHMAYTVQMLDQLYKNGVHYFYGLTPDAPLNHFLDMLGEFEPILKEYQRWFNFIQDTDAKAITVIPITITRKDDPSFTFNTHIFPLLANIQSSIEIIKDFVFSGEKIIEGVKKRPIINHVQKRQFTTLLKELNQHFILHATDQDFTLEKVNQIIQSHLSHLVDMPCMDEKTGEKIGKIKENVETIDLDVDENGSEHVRKTPLDKILVLEEQLHGDISLEPDEEDAKKGTGSDLLNTYNQYNDDEVKYDHVNSGHYYYQDIKNLKKWLNEAVFTLSMFREKATYALKYIGFNQGISDVSAYRIYLEKLYNDSVRHHSFLGFLRTLTDEDIKRILADEIRHSEIKPEYMKQFYPSGNAFCVYSDGVIKLETLNDNKEDKESDIKTLLTPSSRIEVGFPYRFVVQSLPFIQDDQVEYVPAQKTEYHVLLRNAKDVTIHIKDAANTKVVKSITHKMPHAADPVWFQNSENLYIQPFVEALDTPLKSGWQKVEVEGSIDHESKVTLVSDRPYPVTVLKVGIKSKLLGEYH